jgi:hypothetical protein
MAGIKLDIDDVGAGPMRDQIAPVFARGEASGAVTILKSMASSALVRMNS